MAKPSLILGALIGYVLGARAGRGRYEQIKRGANRLYHSKPVQNQLTSAKLTAKHKIAPAALDAVSSGAAAAGTKLRNSAQQITPDRKRDIESVVTQRESNPQRPAAK